MALEADGLCRLVSTPFRTQCECMTLNAAIRGSIRVELRDAAGKALAGYGFGDCGRMAGDALAHPVRWRDRRDLPPAENPQQ